MRLVSAYEVTSNSILYRLLEERPVSANISHQEMPTWKKHKQFVKSRPYSAWFLIMDGEEVLGSIYLTQQDEIGIFLFEKHQGNGHAGKAISMLMKLHPRKRYLANINPNNEGSIRMFKRLGFAHIQNTYLFDV
jgi:RimJ/RimL family protein N-acetyltransferase